MNKSLKTLSTNTKECSHHQDKTKGVGGLPVQVGRINTVSSLGLAKGVGGLPVQVGRTNTVSSLGLAKVVVGLPGTLHLHQAHHKNRHFYFLQPSLVLVETFKPKSLLSRHYLLLPFRPNLKLTFAFNRNCAWLYF